MKWIVQGMHVYVWIRNILTRICFDLPRVQVHMFLHYWQQHVIYSKILMYWYSSKPNLLCVQASGLAMHCVKSQSTNGIQNQVYIWPMWSIIGQLLSKSLNDGFYLVLCWLMEVILAMYYTPTKPTPVMTPRDSKVNCHLWGMGLLLVGHSSTQFTPVLWGIRWQISMWESQEYIMSACVQLWCICVPYHGGGWLDDVWCLMK